MQTSDLQAVVLKALDDLKGFNINIIDVAEASGFTDVMIIVSGSSSRQVKALAGKVVEACKAAGVRPLGVEGEREAEWVLVDLGDIVVHIMLPTTRDFYNLEKLWQDVDLNSITEQSMREQMTQRQSG